MSEHSESGEGTTTGIPGSPGADEYWLKRGVELARRCPPSDHAFSVGALVVSADGALLAEGFSRQDGDADHAEEAALRGLTRASGEAAVSVASLLAHATVYSTLEPCSARASRPRTCSELIVVAGVRRVVIAWREPPLFVDGRGASVLAAAGVAVVEVPQLAAAAQAPNRHLLAP